jgi:hypothetical protein
LLGKQAELVTETSRAEPEFRLVKNNERDKPARELLGEPNEPRSTGSSFQHFLRTLSTFQMGAGSTFFTNAFNIPDEQVQHFLQTRSQLQTHSTFS